MGRPSRVWLFALWLAVAQAAPAAAGSARPPAENYTLHCSGCHGPDGRGVQDAVPTLHGLARLLDTPAGRAYLASVPGVAQAPIDDSELAALLDWVLLSFSGALPQPPYTAEEVHRRRADPLRDPVSARPVIRPDL